MYIIVGGVLTPNCLGFFYLMFTVKAVAMYIYLDSVLSLTRFNTVNGGLWMTAHYQNLRKHRVSIPFHYYSVTTSTLDRNCYFSDFNNARVLINTLKAIEDIKARTICFVVMPDHLHWLFQLQDKVPLATLMREVKGKSSYLINKSASSKRKIWQPGYYDSLIRSEEHLRDVSRYIIANPLRAGIVKNVRDYPYWDCIYL